MQHLEVSGAVRHIYIYIYIYIYIIMRLKVNQGYRRTFRMWNTYCFSTATVVMRTHLIVTRIACLVSFYVCNAEFHI